MVIILKLTKYNEKRKFNKTTEPIGKISHSTKKLKFCIKHHLARKNHFDLRLEHNGTMLHGQYLKDHHTIQKTNV